MFLSCPKIKEKYTYLKTYHNGDSVSSVRVTRDEPVTKELATNFLYEVITVLILVCNIDLRKVNV